jgi:hypothetical protein
MIMTYKLYEVFDTIKIKPIAIGIEVVPMLKHLFA